MNAQEDQNGAPGAAALRVGWIGAGRMGAAMATRVVKAGEDLTVWNRTAAKAEPVAAAGGTIAGSIAELRDRDVVFTMVSTAADLEQVLLGEGGLLVDDTNRPGIVVDCSTVSTDSSAAIRQACHQRGVEFLAAPVSGNAKVIKAGGLTIAVSGPEDTYLTGRAPAQPHRQVGHLRRRGRPVAAGEDRAQHAARRRDAVAGGDHGARRKGRGIAARVPRVPQQQCHGIGVHPVQDAGVREPRLHTHVHAGVVAQGFRPRPGGRAQAGGADAGGRHHRISWYRPASAAAGSTRTSRSCWSCRPPRRASNSSQKTSPSTTGCPLRTTSRCPR